MNKYSYCVRLKNEKEYQSDLYTYQKALEANRKTRLLNMKEIKEPSKIAIARYEVATGKKEERDMAEVGPKTLVDVTMRRPDVKFVSAELGVKEVSKQFYKELNSRMNMTTMKDMLQVALVEKMSKSSVADLLTPIDAYKKVEIAADYHIWETEHRTANVQDYLQTAKNMESRTLAQIKSKN